MLTRPVDGCACLAAAPPNEFALRDSNEKIVSFSGPRSNRTAHRNVFTHRHGGEDGILNAAPPSPGSANLIIFEYQKREKVHYFIFFLQHKREINKSPRKVTRILVILLVWFFFPPRSD